MSSNYYWPGFPGVLAYFWTGAGNGTSWNDPNNWDGGPNPKNDGVSTTPPGAGDGVVFDGSSATIADAGAAFFVDIEGLTLTISGSLSVDASIANSGLFVGVTDVGALALIDGGSLTFNGSGEGAFSITGSFTIEAGSNASIMNAIYCAVMNLTVSGNSSVLDAQNVTFGKSNLSGALGTVQVDGGAHISVQEMNLDGTVTITGSTTKVMATELDVFASGVVSASANVTDSGAFYFGAFSSPATITVTDSSTLLSVNGTLNIGGAAALNIKNQATVTVNGGAMIGTYAGAAGTSPSTVTISGAGSQLKYNGSTAFIVGDVATGALQIFGGATETLGNVVVAQSSSSGTGFDSNNPTPSALEVSEIGSHLKATSLIVGQGGYGTFDVQNAATTEITGDVKGGQNDGSVGTIYVQGLTPPPDAESTPNLNVGGTMAVGVNGTGHLYVQGAGKLSAASLAIGSPGDGSAASGTGTLYIDTGGYVQVTGNMTVDGTSGSGPNGSVSDSGGIITVGGDLDLGDQAGSQVKMTVQGEYEIGYSIPSDVKVTGNLNLGLKTDLYISKGGSLEWGGAVTIVGGGIEIASGGSMQPIANTLGEFTDQHGDVTVEASSSLTTGNMTVDPTLGSVSGGGGFQTLVQADGGTIDITGSLTLLGSGASVFAVDTGTVVVSGTGAASAGPPAPNTFEIDPSGNVSGAGSIGGQIGVATVLDNGTIDAKQTGAGNELIVRGDLEGSGIAQIESNATLSVGQVDPSITVKFTGPSESLGLMQPAQFNGTISGFVPYDKITLVGVQVVPPEIVSLLPITPGKPGAFLNYVQTWPFDYTNKVLWVPTTDGGQLALKFSPDFSYVTHPVSTWIFEATTSPISSAIFLINYSSVVSAANATLFFGSQFAAIVINAQALQSGSHSLSELQSDSSSAVVLNSSGAAQPNLVELTMSVAVTVANGTPTLSFNDGGTAVYDAANSTATTLAFDYTPGPNSVTTLDVTSVNLNGATIQDGNGDNANFFSLIGLPITTTAPVVNSVAASTDNHATNLNAAGHVVTITVSISENVTVTGVPTLQLNDNEVATYTSGSGTDGLTFTYAVQAGDNTSDLQVIGLNLVNGATIQDQSGNALFGTVTGNLGIQIDTSAPIVSSIAAVTDNDATPVSAGHVVTITMKLSEPVTVAGTPTLQLSDNEVATYQSGSGTDTLKFTYTTQLGDNTPDLQVIGLNLPNNVSIEDATGSSLAGPFSADLALQIDSIIGLIAVTDNGTTNVGSGHLITITMSSNEPVTVAGTPILQLNDNEVATYQSGSGTDALTFSYTVQPGDNTSDLQVTGLNLPNGATIGDQTGDSLTGNVAADLGLEVNGSGPPASGPLTTTQIDDVYQAVLQRAPTSSEANVAASQVSGTVIATVVDSTEAQFNVYPIVQIIKLALGTDPTAHQLAGWVPFVESAGLLQGQSQTNPLLDQMATAFVASDNFGKVYNNGVDVDPNSPVTAQEMQVVIQAATGVAATQNQINAWLSTGLTIDQVFVDFALGDQYTAFSQTANQQFLTSVADNAAGIQVVGMSASAGLHAI
jgi:hypothetical protein